MANNQPCREDLPEHIGIIMDGNGRWAKKRALPRLKYAALPSGTALAELVQTSPQAAEIGRLHSRAVDFSSLCREKIQPMGLAFTAKPVVI